MVMADFRLVAAPTKENDFIIDFGRKVDEADIETPITVGAANGLQLLKKLGKRLHVTLLGFARRSHALASLENIGDNASDERQGGVGFAGSEETHHSMWDRL